MGSKQTRAANRTWTAIREARLRRKRTSPLTPHLAPTTPPPVPPGTVFGLAVCPREVPALLAYLAAQGAVWLRVAYPDQHDEEVLTDRPPCAGPPECRTDHVGAARRIRERAIAAIARGELRRTDVRMGAAHSRRDTLTEALALLGGGWLFTGEGTPSPAPALQSAGAGPPP